MKTIELSSGLVNGEEMTTRELIKICLDQIPATGFSFTDLKDRMRIQDALNRTANGKLELEDHDYEIFRGLVTASRWNVRDQFVYDFLKDHVR